MSRAESPLRDRMIFVIGVPRSGTNWIQRILGAHREIATVHSETYLFGQGVLPLRQRFHHGVLTSSGLGSMYIAPNVLADALRDFCDVVFGELLATIAPGARYLVERTPDHIRYLDLIGEIYPDARVVHIIRDGRDVARSLLNMSWGPTQAKEAAHEWRTSIEDARTAATTLSHYVEVRYEDLLTNPEERIAGLFEQLEIPATSEDLRAALEEARASYNVDAASPRIAMGKWRTELSPDVIAAISSEAGPLLAELGYDDHGAPAEADNRRTEAPASVEKVVSLATRVASKIRPRRTPGNDLLKLAERGQQLLDRFLEGAVRDAGQLAPMLSSTVHVRIVDDAHRWEGRGTEAAARLVDTVSADPFLKGRQVVGYMHPAPSSICFVGVFETDGRRAHRVIVLTYDEVAITRVALYRLTGSG